MVEISQDFSNTDKIAGAADTALGLAVDAPPRYSLKCNRFSFWKSKTQIFNLIVFALKSYNHGALGFGQ